MFKYQAIIIVLFSGFLFSTSGTCQSSSDEKLLERLEKTLALDSSQVNSIDSVFKACALQLDSINTKIKTYQTSDLSEDEIGKKTSVLFAERKDLRAWKTTSMLSFLTTEQKIIYNKEILAKAKPVLHFGHNKANCKACDVPTEGAMR